VKFAIGIGNFCRVAGFRLPKKTLATLRSQFGNNHVCQR
jgi:hypothetical protein